MLSTYAYFICIHSIFASMFGDLSTYSKCKRSFTDKCWFKKKKKNKFSYEEFKTDKVSLAGCLCLDQK